MELFRGLSGASGAFACAGAACDHAVGVGEVFPAVLAYHDPAQGFVAGSEGAYSVSAVSADGACSHGW